MTFIQSSTKRIEVAFITILGFLYLIISFTSEDLMETLVKTHVEDEFVQKLARPLVNLEQIFYYFNKKNKKIAKEFKLSSMRFNE